jgi:hypothetical protein
MKAASGYFRELKTVAIFNIVRVRHFLRDRSSHETTRATFCCSPVPQSSRKLCNSTTPSLLKTLHSERPGIRGAFLSTSSFCLIFSSSRLKAFSFSSEPNVSYIWCKKTKRLENGDGVNMTLLILTAFFDNYNLKIILDLLKS